MADKKAGEKKLIIVESPTKAKTIGKFLGPECTIIASNGHIRTLPKADLCIDIENGYKPKYIDGEGKANVVAKIKSELKKADELLLATDEDREGESISWHIVEVCKPKIPYRRMVFHEITKSAILKAFEEHRDINMNLVHAQEARRVLDRLYGYTISPLLWSKLSNKNLSAGRVQSPGLRLIVDRERKRIAFKSSEYRDVTAVFEQGFEARLDSFDGKKIATSHDFDSETGEFSGSSKVMLLKYEDVQVLISSLKKETFTVSGLAEETKYQKPYMPFITSTLQQEGNRKLRLSAKDTMRIAQSLYEKGFITYMRTDSPALSEEGTEAARKAVSDLFGSCFLPESPRHYASKSDIAQEAHEAIRPAGDVFVKPEDTDLTGRELALYSLIYKRTLACQMKDAVKVSTTVSVSAVSSDGKKAEFSAKGMRIEFPGFLRVYVESYDDPDAALEDKEKILPKLEKNQVLTLNELHETVHRTKEPNRYTEASLVQELEKLGIGRPSTYASIIDRILEKQYVVKEGNSLVPTFTGFGVIQLLEGFFADRIDYKFTRDMETDLDNIAGGSLEEVDYLRNFYEGKSGLLSQVKDVKSRIDSKTVKRLNLSQLSEKNSVILGPYGPYVLTEDGKYISVPADWTPANVTDEMVEELKRNTAVRGSGATGPAVVGTSPDGRPILYCTGRYGDYWQIGDMADTSDVLRYKVPAQLKGKVVSSEHIMDFFNLPRIIGTNTDGSEISADIGRFGPYLKCGSDFRSLKDVEEIFAVTESEARKIFSVPKEKKDGGTKRSSVRNAKPVSDKTAPVKDFGEYEGAALAIRSGRYGFYLKHGDRNIRIADKYQHDEDACRQMSLEEAVEYLKK